MTEKEIKDLEYVTNRMLELTDDVDFLERVRECHKDYIEDLYKKIYRLEDLVQAGIDQWNGTSSGELKK